MPTDTTTVDPDDAAYPRSSWGVKAVILAGGPAVGFAIGGMSVVLPKIEAALAHGPEDKLLIKMLTGAVGAAMLLGAPLTGFLADKLGLRKVCFLNYLVFTLAGSAGLYLTNLPLFVFARFLLGVAGAGAVTASIVIINQRLRPSERATWMGRYIGFSYVAGILGFPLVGWLAEQSWHYAFGIYLFGAPFIILSLTSFEPGARIVSKQQAIDAANEESLFRWFPYRLAVLSFGMGCIVYLTGIYLPFELRDMGIGPKQASIVLVVTSLTGIVTSMLFGRSRRYLSADGAFVFMFLTSGIGGIVTGLATSYAVAMLGMAITGLGVGWFMPNLMFVVGMNVRPEQQGRAAGLIKAANYSSTFLAIFAVEGLSQAYGSWLPVLMSGVLALGIMAWILLQIATGRNRNPGLGGLPQAAT